jgi:hypothetical protein
MSHTDNLRRHFVITVYQNGETPSSIRVEFVPRGFQALREPGFTSRLVPTFLVHARLEGKTIVADWEVPPPKDYKADPEELKQEAAARLAQRLEWLDRLAKLIHTVEGWAQDLGWSTKQVRKEMKETEIGAYQTHALLMQEGTTRVVLEPVGSSSPGTEGVVDLYLLPAYDDIATLLYYEGRWNLHYRAPGTPAVGDIHEAESRPLSKTSLRKVLEEMKQHVA